MSKANPSPATEVWHQKAVAHLAPELRGLPMTPRRISRAIERGDLVAHKVGNRVYVSGSALTAFLDASAGR